MIKHFLFILTLLIISILVAQDGTKLSDTVPILDLPHGYVLESVSGTGFENCVNNHIANIGSSNPASISGFHKLAFGISYQFESSSQPGWIADINRMREQNNYPQSIGLIVPLNTFRFGISFSQRYNSVKDFGKFELITIDHPDGTGEFFSATKTEIVYSYSGIFSYSIYDFLGKSNILSIGLKSSFNYLNLKYNFYPIKVNEKASDYSWTFGLRYTIARKIHFGLFYLNSPLFKDSFISKGHEFKVNERMPDKLNIGVLYDLNSYIKFSINLEKVYWHQQSDAIKNYINISGGVTGNITKQISLSMAVLSTVYQASEYQEEMISNLNGLYVLSGLNLRLQHFDIDLAYVTSTKYSGDWRKQKIGKFTLGFYL